MSAGGVFALQTDIMARIESQVPALSNVYSPGVLQNLSADDWGQHLPFAVVVPGKGDPRPQNTLSLPTIEAQDWTVVLLVSHQSTLGEDGQTEIVAGELLQQIIEALHKFAFGSGKARREMRYQGRDAPNYQRGYAEFAVRFSCDVNLTPIP